MPGEARRGATARTVVNNCECDAADAATTGSTCASGPGTCAGQAAWTGGEPLDAAVGDSITLLAVLRRRERYLARAPGPGEVVTWARPRYAMRRERGRSSARWECEFSWGSIDAPDGLPITRRRLSDGDGTRYRVRNRIVLVGERVLVEVDTAVARSTSVADRLGDFRGLATALAEATPGLDRGSRRTGRASPGPGSGVAPATGPTAAGDGVDVWRCSERLGSLTTPGWRECAWLDDVNAATGLLQFRDYSGGALVGANPGWGHVGRAWDQRVIALRDQPVPEDWSIFADGHGGNRVRNETIPASPLPDSHGLEMASVMIADGSFDPDVQAAWHTGAAPGAAVNVYDVNDPEPEFDVVAGVAGALRFDVLVTAVSVYNYAEEDGYAAKLWTNCDAHRPLRCNVWSDDERGGQGRLEADAVDAAFARDGLQVVFSAGNASGNCYSDDSYSIPQGRSAFSAIAVGAVAATSLEGDYTSAPSLGTTMRPMARVAELQDIATTHAFRCGNHSGPTGDHRNYPLLLGYTTMCGVATSHLELAWEDTSGATATATLPLPGESYYLFSGTSASSAHVGGAFVVLKEWLDLQFPGLTSDDAALYRLTLLNMGDRSGAYASDDDDFGMNAFAVRGLPRHAGFGKPRLRLLDGCHFNEGVLETHTWAFHAAGDTYVAGLEWEGGSWAPVGALPADLARFRVVLWLELDSARVEDYEDRPFALLYLQRRDGPLADWETVALTYTGHEYVPDSEIYRSIYMKNVDREILRDPHANIALDNGWGIGGSVQGGGQWRVVVLAILLPSTPVTAHLSVMWETGDDPSLAANRAATWRCPPTVTDARDELADLAATLPWMEHGHVEGDPGDDSDLVYTA